MEVTFEQDPLREENRMMVSVTMCDWGSVLNHGRLNTTMVLASYCRPPMVSTQGGADSAHLIHRWYTKKKKNNNKGGPSASHASTGLQVIGPNNLYNPAITLTPDGDAGTSRWYWTCPGHSRWSWYRVIVSRRSQTEGTRFKVPTNHIRVPAHTRSYWPQ